MPAVSGCVSGKKKRQESEEEDDNKRKKTECVGVAGNVFSYLCAAASWCAATTLKVLLSAKWLMIQTPTNCHAILFPMRPCSLPHLLPHGAVTSVEQCHQSIGAVPVSYACLILVPSTTCQHSSSCHLYVPSSLQMASPLKYDREL